MINEKNEWMHNQLFNFKLCFTFSNMDNNVRLLADVSADIDRLLESPAQERTVKNESKTKANL